MIKNKIISVILIAIAAVCLNISILTIAAGVSTYSVTLEQATVIARDKLQIPENYKLAYSFLKEKDDLERRLLIPRWTLYYANGKKGYENNIRAEIDVMNGEVVGLSLGEPEINSDNAPTPLKYKRSEAQKFSEQLMKKLIKLSDYEQLYLVGNKPSYIDEHYRPTVKFHYKRMINGYPYLDDGIEISVDRMTGKVFYYNRTWTNCGEQSKESFLSPAGAAKIFFEKAGLELGYVKSSYYDSKVKQNKEQIIPAYYPRIQKIIINALTGEMINEYGNKPNIDIADQKYEPLSSPISLLGSAKKVEIEQAKEKAVNTVKIPSDYILSESKRDLVWGDWAFVWQNKDDSRKQIKVSVAPETGEITYLYYSQMNENDSPAGIISKDDAREIAVKFIKQFLPYRIHLLGKQKYDYGRVYTEDVQDGSHFRFYFPVMVNGLPFRENGVSIRVTSEGELASYEAKIGKHETLSKDNLISEQEAKSIFERSLLNNLSYVYSKMENKGDIIPVYKVGSQYGSLYSVDFIDARTGLLNIEWGISDEEKNIRNELSGHWAVKDIVRLTSMRVIDPKDGFFNPDIPVSRAEMTKMLVKALMINPYYPQNPSFVDVSKSNIYMGYIEALKQKSIINGTEGKFNPDNYLTREEMAVILSKITPNDIEYNTELSILKDHSSISPWAKQGIDQVMKSGLMRGDLRGNFNPKQKLTNAETVVLLSRLIERLD